VKPGPKTLLEKGLPKSASIATKPMKSFPVSLNDPSSAQTPANSNTAMAKTALPGKAEPAGTKPPVFLTVTDVALISTLSFTIKTETERTTL
jgi:hypothetical protein